MCYSAYGGICFFWGTSNLVTKIGVGGLPAPVFGFARYLTAGLLLLVLALARKQSLPKDRKIILRLLLIGLIMHFGTNGCVVLGNQLTDSSIVTMLLATVPIFAALIQCFILKTQRLSRTGWLGLVGGFAGIALVALSGSGGAGSSLLGMGLVLLGACFWATGSMFSAGVDTKGCLLAVTSMQMLFAAGVYFIAGTVTHTFDLSALSLATYWPAAYMAVVDSILGFLLYAWLLREWDPFKASTYAYVNPVVALILGALILKEPITPGKIAGMAVIIISVCLVQRSGKTKKEMVSYGKRLAG